MNSRKYSIITITWNNATGLKRTLDSIRALRYTDRELIVIDGASTDGTAEVASAYGDIITTFVSENDNGIYNAMNEGLRHVHGDYVVFMNAGDCFASPGTLDVVSRYDGDIILGSGTYGGSTYTVKDTMTLYDVLSTGICHQATYYKASVIRKYGMDERFRLLADLKSVVEPMARDNVSVSCITDILAVCEGGGVSKQRWRDTLIENRRIIEEVVSPYYRDDYIRFARISNSMLSDFALLSSFRRIFPLLRLLARVMRFMNNHFKHIPV